MSIEALRDGVERLRTIELRRAVRGVDPEQTRQLLEEAADLLADAAREQKELRSEIELLTRQNDETAVGKALVTATRTGEALIAEAREEAASLRAEADAEASALLERVRSEAERLEQETKAAREQLDRELADARQAHAKELETAKADANAALADARSELVQLEKRAAHLSSLVADMERRIVEIAQDALQELEKFGASANSATTDEFLADIQPATEFQESPAE